jgi:large subunit ribosomal protein L9
MCQGRRGVPLRIQVLFVTDVPPKYRAGEVRAVAGGYARNYLFPKEMAVPATAEHRKRIAKIMQVAEVRRTRETQETQVIANRLNDTSVTIRVRAGDRGRLYGSVTNAAIADAITQASGLEVDRRLIQVPEPIRNLGTFPVTVRLQQDVSAVVNVVVEDVTGRRIAQPAEAPDGTPEAPNGTPEAAAVEPQASVAAVEEEVEEAPEVESGGPEVMVQAPPAQDATSASEESDPDS